MPRSTRQNTTAPINPATTKRTPTKNNGPVWAIATWMIRKVAPQIMVMPIRISSGRLTRSLFPPVRKKVCHTHLSV